MIIRARPRMRSASFLLIGRILSLCFVFAAVGVFYSSASLPAKPPSQPLARSRKLFETLTVSAVKPSSLAAFSTAVLVSNSGSILSRLLTIVF